MQVLVLLFGMVVSSEVTSWLACKNSPFLFIIRIIKLHKIGSTGDVNGISIGTHTNIQDNSLIHVSKTNIGGISLPVAIGSRVTIGNVLIWSTFMLSLLCG